MIDEFQDTSTIQWKNFKVLLEETMSREDAGNLIVGDVKQSIYRWRSGDWRLLNNIESEFINPKKQLDIETLDTNYRSDRNVIDFNNAFFVEAAKQEYENLKKHSSCSMPTLTWSRKCLHPKEHKATWKSDCSKPRKTRILPTRAQAKEKAKE